MKYFFRGIILAASVLHSISVAGDTNINNPKRISIDNLANVDEDFAYQGEYVGKVSAGRQKGQSIGLQVIARGNGQFDATFLAGGLPGAGWDGFSQTSLQGIRADEQLLLKDDHYHIHVTSEHAEVRWFDGTLLGHMRKHVRMSPTLGASPPPNAQVLFNGVEKLALEGGEITEDGLLTTGITTAFPVTDFRLHLEFRTPYMPLAKGQSRGNSGVYIQQRYEVQILDSFGLTGEANECGGLYRQVSPDVNMCLPPLTWQTYDIGFQAAKWDEKGEKISNAHITVLHNGKLVHQQREIVSKTGAGKEEGPDALPIHFQHHGDPVRFRNIWLVTPGPTEDVLASVQSYVFRKTSGDPRVKKWAFRIRCLRCKAKRQEARQKFRQAIQLQLK